MKGQDNDMKKGKGNVKWIRVCGKKGMEKGERYGEWRRVCVKEKCMGKGEGYV